MRNIIIPLILGSSLILLFASCNREPLFPVEPRIEVLDISPKIVKSLKDSIVVRFRFEDGDGDIGVLPEDDPSTINLRLIDSRSNNPNSPIEYTYRLPNLTQDTRNPSIQGEVSVKVDFTNVLSPFAQSEEFRYQIVFLDRAENTAKSINGNDEAVYTDFIEVVR